MGVARFLDGNIVVGGPLTAASSDGMRYRACARRRRNTMDAEIVMF